MSTLLVDIGNTRIKWQVLQGRRRAAVRAKVHAREPETLRSVIASAPSSVSRVIAVNVAGEKLARALTTYAKARFGVTPTFVRSARRALGVTNGYRDTWRLGVDRWVASIAAHRLVRGKPVIVVSVGTAMTIDAVSARGKHLGGVIVPGPRTMIHTLLNGTHGIRRRAQGGSAHAPGFFARETRAALASGASHAAAALVERAVNAASKRFGEKPVVILTGGGASTLRRFIKNARVVPDLLLRGLADFT